MPATTNYSTGFGSNEIYRLQGTTEGSVEVYSSGTKAVFAEGAKLEMKAGSTLDMESGALLNLAGVQRITGQVELKSGAELELEAGSTLNVEAGGSIKFAPRALQRYSTGAVVTYTCSTYKLNIWDRYVTLRSSDPHGGDSDICWTLRHPQANYGILKTIFFQSPKGSTHDLVLRTTTVKIGFNSTNKHTIVAAATNPFMVSTAGYPGIFVTLMAASSSIWKIMSPMSTDVKVGKLQLTSSTEYTP